MQRLSNYPLSLCCEREATCHLAWVSRIIKIIFSPFLFFRIFGSAVSSWRERISSWIIEGDLILSISIQTVYFFSFLKRTVGCVGRMVLLRLCKRFSKVSGWRPWGQIDIMGPSLIFSKGLFSWDPCYCNFSNYLRPE